MGVRINQRLPRALAGLFAVALMAVAATTTLSAQTTMTPRLVVRALTNGDIATYKLPSTTQVSGGLETVGLGEPLYLEVQIDIGIPASQIAGVIWTLTSKAPIRFAGNVGRQSVGIECADCRAVGPPGLPGGWAAIAAPGCTWDVRRHRYGHRRQQRDRPPWRRCLLPAPMWAYPPARSAITGAWRR